MDDTACNLPQLRCVYVNDYISKADCDAEALSPCPLSSTHAVAH